MNKVILVGRLVKDPELRRTNTDIAVVQFTVAVNRRFPGPDGKIPADFISCVAWRNQAENLARYMRKGSLIGIEGQIQTRTYDDPSGQRRYITEVVCDNISFLESKGARENTGYHDVNNYDIPAERRNEPNADPFKNIGQDQSYNESDDSGDPFANLSTSNGVSDDDLPF